MIIKIFKIFIAIFFISNLLVTPTKVYAGLDTPPQACGTSSNPCTTTPAPGSITPTNAVQTCGSMVSPVATLGSSVNVASLNCSGAGAYDVRIIPTSGSPLVGTITASDSILASAPSSRRFYKNGVGALETATENLTSTNTTPLTYRFNGGDNLTITLSNYVSGSAAVYITASFTSSMVLINGPVDNREEAALRQGKAFTSSTGSLSVTVGQYLSLMLSNPSNSGVRLVIPALNRIVACNNPSNAALPIFQSRPNVATNTPSTALSITRRGGTTGASSAAAYFSNSANLPDTNPATTNPVGLPFFSSYAIPQDRTLEPGNSVTITIKSVGTGLTGANDPMCSIIISWFEETLN